jgi:hypothetical protein
MYGRPERVVPDYLRSSQSNCKTRATGTPETQCGAVFTAVFRFTREDPSLSGFDRSMYHFFDETMICSWPPRAPAIKLNASLTVDSDTPVQRGVAEYDYFIR